MTILTRLIAWILVLGVVISRLATAGAAPQFTTLADFTGANGSNIEAGLVQGNDGNFYGTTYYGGNSDNGTIFKMTPAGTVTTLVNFDGADGSYPQADLVLGTDGNFYGTTFEGGTSQSDGTVFKVTPSGTLTTLYDFSGTDGTNPATGLVLGSDGNFYGTTAYGGNTVGVNVFSGLGTIFKVTPAGALTTLVNFNSANGSHPMGKLIQGSDGNFYGTASNGGNADDGTVFRVTPSGSLTTLHSFSGADGSLPDAGLVPGSDGDFYGTTVQGGNSETDTNPGCGTVFKVTLAGTLTTLANFDSTNGAAPAAALVQGLDGDFYGTTILGGSSNAGTVFRVAPSGTVTTLYSFSGTDVNNDNMDGAYPQAALVLGSDGNFYSPTQSGGTSGNGVVFKITAESQSLDSFSALSGSTNSNGANPTDALVQSSDGNFYGTDQFGGTSGDGTVFQVTPSGVLTNLVTFNGTNGANPYGALVEGSDGNFYGTTQSGGISGKGTVFKVTPTGTLTTLVDFNSVNGAVPFGSLIQSSDGNFYGTTYRGGTANIGTVFKMTPAGTRTTLVSFTTANGAHPAAGLIEGLDGDFYGTTAQGGSANAGTLFKITPSGTLVTLVDFKTSNGASPFAALVQTSNGDLYGTTEYGGSSGYGTVFQLTQSGALTTLVNFTSSNGTYPLAGLLQGLDGNFYGTASQGGRFNQGTAFKITPSGMLTTLIDFTNILGSNPLAGLVQGSDGDFYGTTAGSGVNGTGTIFRLTGPVQAYGASATTPENSPVFITLDLFDPSGFGFDSVQIVMPPSHGSIMVIPDSLLEYGLDGYASVFYQPNQNYVGPDGFTYTGTGYTGTTVPQTVTVMVTSRTPVITSFTPASGPAGTTVTIMGTNLTGTSVVGFQGQHAASFTVNGAGTQITTTVPSGAVTGPIAVLTPYGQARSAASFTVTAAYQKPVITGFMPASGAVGTTVTIMGTNLTGTSVVGFQNMHAKTFTVNSQGTQITTVVPSGAVTGPIAVLTPGGEAKSTASFTVTH